MSNVYCRPTPIMQDKTGQLTGYTDQTVLTDEAGQPLTDEQGNWETE